MTCAFIDEQRAQGRGVELICRVLREQGLQVAPRTYRAWKANAPATRVVEDAAIVDTLRQLRTAGTAGGPLPEVLYGRRKMIAWLVRNGLPGVSKHTVDRLMRQEGMRGLVRGRKTRTTIPGKDARRARDLLNRQFRTTAPNRAWVTDFTYCSTWSGFTTWRSRSTCTPPRSSAGRRRPQRTSRSSSLAWRWRCGGAITPADRYPRA